MKKLTRFLAMTVSVIALMLCSSFAFGQATVSTDAQDYPPGSTVIITGSGFTPGEAVTLQVLHTLANGDNDTSPAHQPWTVSADSLGNINSTWLVPADEDELGATLKLTADEQSSGLHAETTFTDASKCGTPTVSAPSPLSQTVCSGSTITFTVTATPEVAGGTLTYRWKIQNIALANGPTGSGSIISGATTSTLTITNVQPSDANIRYNVDVTEDDNTNPACTPQTMNSGNATLVVNQAVSITAQPATTQTTCSGNSVSFTVTATGTGLTYQWRKGTTNLTNGGNISGATTATLTINPVATGDAAANYNVVVSGTAPCTSVTSNNAALIVNQAVSITGQPTATQTTCSGNSVSFTVASTGTGLTYQWRKGTTNLTDGGSISGANTATLTINPVATGDAAANYNVVVSGTAPCAAVTSNNAALVVNQAVSITGQPVATQTTCSGNSVSFTVTASGTGLTYQWRKGTTNLANGGSISGATTATLTINPVATGDAVANYNVVVSGTAPCTPVTSNDAALVVNQAVAITGQPAATQTTCSGNSVSFSVTATGTGLTYQWRKGTTNLTDGGSISGANTATLTINPVTTGDAATNYNVVVSGTVPCTAVTSNNATLVVNQEVSITGQPAATQTTCSGNSVSFTVAATGTGLTYQWRKGTTNLTNGGSISGATTATLTINPVATGDAAANYNVVVSGTAPCTPVTSNNAALVVNQPVAITGQPAATQTVCSGTSVSFSVTATGTGLTYQWKKGATNLTDGGSISGANTSTLTINPVGAGDAAANYNVVVSGTAPCTPVTSNNAALVVNTPPSITSQPAVTPTTGTCDGNGVQTISVTASGTSLTYSWRKGGIPVVNGGVISGQGTATLTLTNPTAADGGSYDVVISGSCPPAATSNPVTVTINPLPTVFNVGFTGSLCATATISLSGSEIGVNYALLKNNSTIETKPGTGTGISFAAVNQNGTYTVVATNATTNCTSNMNGSVTINSGNTPTIFNVTGGGTICTGDAGVHVGLSSSQNNTTYQLYRDNVAVGSPLTGSNNTALDFGLQNVAGNYTVIATSNSNCTANMNGSATVTVNTAPTISGCANITVNTDNNLCSAVVTYTPTITGTPAPTITHTFTGATTATNQPGSGSGLAFNKGTTHVVITAHNSCSPDATCSFDVIVNDTQKPTVTAPSTVDIECETALPAAASTIAAFNALAGASASDNCTPTASLTVSSSTGALSGTSCNGTITRTYTITDGDGNSTTVNQTFTVTDNTKPTVIAPSIVDLECESDLPAAAATITAFNALAGASASDNCTPTASLTVTSSTGALSGTSCNGTITRTYTISDVCGNSTTVNQTFTVTDNTKPTVTAPSTVDIECESALPAAASTITAFNALAGASASDNCTPTASLTVTSSTGALSGTSCNGTITRTYTISDICGNSTTVNQTFTVTDNTKPTVTAPSTVDIECESALPAAASTITAFNALAGASASDNCTPTANLTVTSTTGSLVGTSCNGTITRTYTVSDVCGNSTTVDQTFTVTDNTKPTVTAPSTVDIECESALPAAASTIAAFNALAGASASDNCTPTANLTVTSTTGSLVGTSCNGTITRTYTISDVCGNSTTVDQTFTVTDNTKPTVTAPSTVDLECASALPAAASTITAFNALAGASASDNCTPTASLTVTSTTGSLVGTSCNGTITRTYTISDVCGNSTTVDQTFTVTDNTKPTVTAPSTVDLECESDLPAAASTITAFNALAGASASDNCTPTASLTVTSSTGALSGTSCNGTIIRTYTISDVCGNSTTVNQTFTVTDNTKPTVTAPSTVDLECASDLPAAASTITAFNALAGASASDNCTPTASLTVTSYTGALAGTSCNGTITRKYTISDACGNSTTVNQTFTVTDNTKPNVTAPSTVDLECESDLPAAASTITAFNALAGASASDNCTPTASLTVTSTTGSLVGTSCNGTITRTYTISDVCGNSTTVDQTFTVTDNTKPAVTAPSTVDLECESDLPAAASTITAFNALAGASASDNCTPTASLTVTSSTGALSGTSCNGTIIRTYTISDVCGNSTTVNQTFTVTDNTKPTVTAPSTIDLECPSDLPAAASTITAFNVLAGASASDNCTPTANLTVTSYTGALVGTSCNGTITRKYTISDACGNSTTVNQTFTVTDNTKPTVTAPSTVDLECESDLPAAASAITAFNALAGASASDNCTPTASLTVTSTTGSLVGTSCNGTITRTYTISDVCGNSTTVDQTFTVTDNTKPTVTAPSTVDLECASDLPTAASTITAFTALAGASASDNCTPTASLTVTSYTGALVGTSCNGTITRKYTISDVCGNSTTVNQTFTVTDNTKPTVTAPSTVDLECESDLPAAASTITAFNALAGASASDNCTPTANLTVTSSTGALSGTSCNGTITRTYTISDVCGNSTTVNQTFTVTDNTKPTVTAPSTVDLECASDLPAAASTITAFNGLAGASASDNCTPTANLTVTSYTGALVGTSCNGTITRKYTISDVCGNSTTVNQIFTVTDNTKPTVTAPSTVDLECESDLPAAASTITAFNALAGASASDNCTPTGSLTVTSSTGALSGTSCNGTIIRTYTISDVCGNSTTVNQTFTVTDNTKPTVTAPSTVDLECASDLPAAASTITAFNALAGASASDNCTPTASLTVTSYTGALVGTSCNGTITRKYTISDVCGNSTTVNQTFTVTDNTKPTVTAPSTVDLECASDLPAAASTITAFNALAGASASDNCTPTASLTVTSSTGALSGTSCNGTIIRTYTISDVCGNSTTVNQTFTVTDNTTPTVTAPSTVDLECASDLPAAASTITAFNALAGASASDNCTPTASLTVTSYTGALVGTSCNGTITRKYTISDVCGNSTTVNQTFTVTDNTKPTVTAPSTVDLECESDLPAAASTITAFNALAGASASDNCTPAASLTVTSTTGALVGTSCNGTIKRIYTITDACSNSATVCQTFTVTDNTKPTVTAPSTVDLECASDLPASASTIAAFNALAGASASDNCTPTASLTVSSTTGSLVGTSCNGTITRTYTVTDLCGNSTTVNQTFTVTDNTKPTVTAPSTVDLECASDLPVAASTIAAFNALAGASASDNCTPTSSLTVTSYTGALVGTSCNGTITRKYTISDACGNSTTVNQTFTVTDNTKPTVTAPSTVDLECASDLPAAASTITAYNALAGASASDNCTPTASLTVTSSTGALVGTSCNGTITRTYTVTDLCGNSTTVNQTFTVTDNTKPVITGGCKSNASRVFDLNETNYTVKNGEFDQAATDNCNLASMIYTLSGATLGGGTLSSISLDGVDLNGGTTYITWTATDACGNISTCKFSVTVNQRPTDLTYTGDFTEQYSDQQLLTATLTDHATGTVLSAKTVTFTLGSQTVSDGPGAPGNGTDASGVAQANLVLTQGPGTYNLSGSFAGDAIYLPSSFNYSNGFTIAKEDACANYNGDVFLNSTSATGGTALVNLKLALTDKNDGFRGNITNATVYFTVMDGANVAYTGPATLVSSSVSPDNTLAWFAASFTANLGSNCLSKSYDVTWTIGGYYQNDASCSDVASVVTVSAPTSDFITGGGYVILDATATGKYAGDIGSKNNFGFNVKWNKSLTNIQGGGINTIVRKAGHEYQIKGTKVTALTVIPANGTTPATAGFSCNAVINDIVGGVVISSDGNATAIVEITDVCEPGSGAKASADLIAITVKDKNGVVVYSNHWNAALTKTDKVPLDGGNLQIHSGTALGAPTCTPTTTRMQTSARQPEQLTIIANEMAIRAYPNPSQNEFTLQIESDNLRDKISLRVFDMAGRTVQTFTGLSAGQTLKIGSLYKQGVYFIDMMQGDKHKQLKIVKQ